jgi:hypothetical protein
MKNLMVLTLFLTMLFLGTVSAEAANRYVRAGASGSANGTDWTNAYTTLPSTLTRGDTYYIADGSYGSYTFDDAPSGTTLITVKKATVASHGADTGWDNTYGDGQAIWTGWRFSGNTGYITLDGQSPAVRYGFWVDFAEGSQGAAFTSGGHHTTIRYTDISGFEGSGGHDYSAQTLPLYIASGSGNTDFLTISHCRLRGGDTLIQWEHGNDAIIEYNDLTDNLSTGSLHGNIVYFTGNAQRVTFRYNRAHNYNTEGFFVTGYGGSNISNIYIYGNVFYDGIFSGYYSRGIELRQDYTYGAFYVYNNTCVNLTYICVTFAGGTSGGEVRNNLSVNAGGFSVSGAASNNLTGATSLFVSVATDDYHLSGPTAAGFTLASQFAKDPDGVTRGGNGVWDVGAYELGTGGDVMPPAIPTNLQVQ